MRKERAASPPGQRGGGIAQAAGLAARSRIARPPAGAGARAEELLVQPGGTFATRSADRNTLTPPSGTFNFVRVEGDTPRARTTLVSSALPHAQIAAGRPVLYAGTARFDRGAIAWWSNYSGTYQPVAAYRDRAALPAEKFVPWQQLALGGVALQRGTFLERRDVSRPTPHETPPPTSPRPDAPARSAAAAMSAPTAPPAGGAPQSGRPGAKR